MILLTNLVIKSNTLPLDDSTVQVHQPCRSTPVNQNGILSFCFCSFICLGNDRQRKCKFRLRTLVIFFQIPLEIVDVETTGYVLRLCPFESLAFSGNGLTDDDLEGFIVVSSRLVSFAGIASKQLLY